MAPGASLHVLEVLDRDGLGDLERRVIALAQDLRSLGARVSAMCPAAGPAATGLRDAGCEVLLGAMGRDPPWPSVRAASTYVLDEHVQVLHVHAGHAHVLGSVVAAVTGRPLLATVHHRELTMLEVEAHRFAPHAHFHVLDEHALQHARAIGIAAGRVHRIDRVGDAARSDGKPSRVAAGHPLAVADRDRAGARTLHDLLARLAASRHGNDRPGGRPQPRGSAPPVRD